MNYNASLQKIKTIRDSHPNKNENTSNDTVLKSSKICKIKCVSLMSVNVKRSFSI
jgi:hypothetical protein